MNVIPAARPARPVAGGRKPSRLAYTSSQEAAAQREAAAARREDRRAGRIANMERQLTAENGTAAEYGVKVYDAYGKHRYVTDAHGVAWVTFQEGTESVEWWVIER